MTVEAFRIDNDFAATKSVVWLAFARWMFIGAPFATNGVTHLSCAMLLDMEDRLLKQQKL